MTLTLNRPQSCVRVHASEAGSGRLIMVAGPMKSDAFGGSLSAYDQIAGVLSGKKMQIVHERIFGSLSAEPAVMEARCAALHKAGLPASGPVTYVEGNPPRGEGFAGAIIHAVTPESPEGVRTIMDGEYPCGRAWRRDGLTHIVLQNIQAIGGEPKSSKSAQTRRMLERAERILRENGASYRDVVRTWFYLSGILNWYASFNKVRNEKYGEFGIMPGPGDKDLLLPASTGIGGDTPSGAAAAMDLIAIIGDADTRPVVKRLSSAAQLDAFRYGSAFSRGALITERDVSLIEVSGAAAIDRQGKSQFAGDIRGQIDCTFDKIEKLLAQEGAVLGDIAAATVFVKRPQYAEIFWEMARDRGLEEFPAVCVVADVCRDELLFEIDAEAVIERR